MKRYNIYLGGDNQGTIPTFSVLGDKMIIAKNPDDKRGAMMNPPPQWAILKGEEIVALVPFTAGVEIEDPKA